MPPVSPVGLTTGLCGLARAPANLSPLPDNIKGQKTSGICGLTSLTSSVPTGPLSSWESRLRERLAMVGSTEYDLTWKAKTTPQGRSMSQLAPSIARTSDRDCTGWPTPATRDHKGGYQGGRIRNGKISNDTLDVTVQHTVHGLNTSGLPEPTESRGALHPAFSCWLMGFPPEWESCAPLATPSSRRSRQKS